MAFKYSIVAALYANSKNTDDGVLQVLYRIFYGSPSEKQRELTEKLIELYKRTFGGQNA